MGWLLLLVFSLLTVPAHSDGGIAAAESAMPQTCSYNTYEWNTRLKKAVNYRRVEHPYTQISGEERDPHTGCSLCEEDQVLIKVGEVPAFRMCRQLAGEVETLLNDLLDEGVPILEITGYRVGKTRGATDAEGLRTVFSNHSYGTALDINAAANGLYDRCLTFGTQCRLIRGGHWQSDNPLSWTANGPLVQAFKSSGFRWGGEIQGWQKDFMHFSPTGY